MLAALTIEHHYLRPQDALSGANPITMRAPLRWVGVRAANWQSERVARVKQSDTQREWNLAAAAGARVSLSEWKISGHRHGDLPYSASSTRRIMNLPRASCV